MSNLTPEQHIKRHLIREVLEDDNDFKTDATLSTGAEIDEAWEILVETDLHWDYVSDFREGEERTGLGCEYSRHYEAESVGTRLSDDVWVGWTYWFGGGKHGDPDSIPWMNEAYFLDVTEETRVINVFARRDDADE